MDLIRVQHAGLDQLLDFGHRHAAGGRHHRIEVPRGLAIHEIALGIAFPRLHDGQIGSEPGLEHEQLAIDLTLLLAFGHHRARAGACIEPVDAGSTGADALGQGSLRVEFEHQFLREILAFELAILADVGRHHLADLPRRQQQSEPEAIDACVVGDDGEIAHA